MIQEGNDFSGAVSEIEWQRVSRLIPVFSATNSQPQRLKPRLFKAVGQRLSRHDNQLHLGLFRKLNVLVLHRR